MKKIAKMLSTVLFVSACGQGKDVGFTTLDELCNAYVEAVCDGRDSCCEEREARAVCESDLLAQCNAAHADLTAESRLSYSGEKAFRRLQEMREDLLACAAPYNLATFFEGGLEAGQPCARHSQCKSLLCGTSGSRFECLEAADAALCEPGNQ